jgi:hypothetical protein
MTRALANVTTTNQFQNWFNTTNFLATYLSTEIVTANSAGGVTVGNGFVQGYFGANNLSTTSLSGGNTTVSANLTITSNAIFNAGMQSSNTTFYGFSNTTSGTGSQVLDYWALASYRSCEYTMTIKCTSGSNGFQMSKVLMLQAGDTAVSYFTEYGQVLSNTTMGVLGSYAATANATHAILSITPTVTAALIQGSKILTGV